jgi:hypothetical protein
MAKNKLLADTAHTADMVRQLTLYFRRKKELEMDRLTSRRLDWWQSRQFGASFSPPVWVVGSLLNASEIWFFVFFPVHQPAVLAAGSGCIEVVAKLRVPPSYHYRAQHRAVGSHQHSEMLEISNLPNSRVNRPSLGRPYIQRPLLHFEKERKKNF